MSIIKQTYPSIEIIIADDKSKYFDCAFFEDFIKKNNNGNVVHFKVYQNEQNFGTVKNINGALHLIQGTYVKLLAADDALFDENVLCFAAAYLKKSLFGVITSDVMKCDDKLRPTKKYFSRLQDRLNSLDIKKIFSELCFHNGIIAGGVFFKNSFFSKYGYHNEAYRLIEDWPMWLKITMQGVRIQYAPFFAVKYRANVGSATGVNQLYLDDKLRILNEFIIPSKKNLGLMNYIKARAFFYFRSSIFIRKLYGILFRYKS